MKITTFRALRYRNYRLFFAGQSLSLMGTWMQKTAVSWVIYSLTQSKFMLGVSVFATLFPSALFSLYGGIISDRYNRYKILLLTQVLSMLQAILLTLLVYFKHDAVWGIIGLSVMLGIINGFDVPARQSLVPQLIEDEKYLPNALALNSSMVNLSKLVGPAVAGIAIEKLGEVACFGLNALSFIPVISSLLLLKLSKAHPQKRRDRNIKREFREAISFIRSTPSVRMVITLLACTSLLVQPFTTLTPVYAKDIFHGTASTFGIIDGFIGLGAFIGALFLASLKPGTNLSRILSINTFVFGTGLIFFSHTTSYPLALSLLAISAFGMMSLMTLSNTIIQLNVTHELRGRVISIFVMVFTAMLPLGSLLIGSVSHYAGVQNTVLVEGIIALILAVLYGIYTRKLRLSEEAAVLLNEQPGQTIMQE